MNIDTLIVHGDLFTMTGEGVGYVDDGAVAIKDNKIIEVGDSNDLLHKYQPNERIDATNKMVLPGFVDAHMHTSLSIIRGTAQDTDAWMHKGIGPFMPFMGKKDMLAGSKMNILEALAAGTTTFGDYNQGIMLELAGFYDELGARASLTSTIREVPDSLHGLKEHDLYPFEPDIGKKTLSDNLELISQFEGRDDGRIRTLLGPQGPDFMSRELLLKVKDLSTEKNIPIHMHVAQGSRESKQIEGRYGKRSIAYLDELGMLDSDLIAVHLTEAKEEEVQLVVDRKASMILCSGSIGIIDGIVPPAYSFLEKGGKVGLGSDQAPGNNCNQMINEMKLTALFNKIKYEDPEKMQAWKVLRMATIEGARAIGRDDEIGSIEEGKKADIIFVDLKEKTMQPVIKTPMRNHVPNLVYSARGHEIQRVMVDGKTLYIDGEYKTVDEEHIMHDCQVRAQRLSEKVSEEDFKVSAGAELMRDGKL